MRSFKVLSFNMQFGKVWDPLLPDSAPVRLEQTIEELKKHAADIVLLQEVEKVLPGGRQAQPPPNYERILEALPGYHGFFAYPATDEGELPFGFGQAILSREPLGDTQSVDLPAAPVSFEFEGKETAPTKRLLIGAKTRVDGREIQVFNVHLQAFFMIGASSNDHPQQRDRVIEHLKVSTLPTLAGGDFNIGPGEYTLACFEQEGFTTAQKEATTWKRMPFVTDHIFYNAQLALKGWQLGETMASDHDVIIAEMAFAAPSKNNDEQGSVL